MRAAPPPAGFAVRLAVGVLLRDDSRCLVGGLPLRRIRLSPAGFALVARWRTTTPLGRSDVERALARRLLDVGLLDPTPAPTPTPTARLAVVVPARDRPEILARCLGALRRSVGDQVDVVVVDDGSAHPTAIARTAEAVGARVVRHASSRGPGPARNSGLEATGAELVLFVDSDVVVEGDAWLRLLLAHMDDPGVGAVAPRVLALDETTRSWIAGYERRHSSLDMGASGGVVGIGRPVSYVPSATLLTRRSAIPEGGFAEDLPVGEDVDFCWRMAAAGSLVRYVPEAAVRHEHRIEPGPFLRRRADYARSIGPLARRHPAALSALRADPALALLVGLVAAGRPRAAAVPATYALLRARRRLDGDTSLAARLTARAALGTAHGLSHAVRRVWSPLLLLAALRHPRAAVKPLAMSYILRLAHPGGPRHPTDLALSAADDLIAALGTWESAINHRTPTPLLASTPRGSRPRRRTS